MVKKKSKTTREQPAKVPYWQDELYNKTTKKVRDQIRKFNTSELAREISSLHATRRIRSLESSDILASQQKQLIDATLQNQAFRSRAVEIKMQMLKISLTGHEHLSILINYMLATHKEELKSEAASITDRKSIVNNWLRSEWVLLNEVDNVVALCDLLIEDCDQAGWSLKRITDTLALNVGDR